MLALVAIFSCSKSDRTPLPQFTTTQRAITNQNTAIAGATTATVPRHVVIVWLENKGYSQIVGSNNAPYINTLVAKGTLFTNAHGITHPSYPNYVAWFSGSTQGIKNDDCISGTPYKGQTIYNALYNKGITFRWYNEDLPGTGSTTCKSGYYVEKHNPTTIFSTVGTYINMPLSSIHLNDTATFSKLPRVACITPNLMHDMHDGSIRQGDDWVKASLSKLVDWSLKNNSIVVIYFDENDGEAGNRIPVVMIGQHIKAGYKNTAYYTHFSFAKTILNWYGANSTFTTNLANAASISNIWK